MAQAAKPTRHNRPITVDLQDEATSGQRLGAPQAFVEFVRAFRLSLGFPLLHQASCSEGGSLPRPSPSARVRLGGLTLWRVQGPTGQAVCTGLPHGVLRYRQRRPAGAREALLAPHGGRRVERCAGLSPLAPLARSRLRCACGHHSLVTLWTRWDLPLPTEVLADEQHRRCLTNQVSWPTLVGGRVLWHRGSTAAASTAALTQSDREVQHAALPQEPWERGRGILSDGLDRTTRRLRTLCPGAR